jgi:hypothetical protein
MTYFFLARLPGEVAVEVLAKFFVDPPNVFDGR